jgi:hypothetical protein
MGLGSTRAFADLGHPEIRRALWITLAFTVGSFAGLFAVVEFSLSTIQVADGGWIQSLFGWLIGVLGGFATLALSRILFPAVATFSAGSLLEDIAAQLEATHNPSVIGGAIASAQFALMAVALNLVASRSTSRCCSCRYYRPSCSGR